MELWLCGYRQQITLFTTYQGFVWGDHTLYCFSSILEYYENCQIWKHLILLSGISEACGMSCIYMSISACLILMYMYLHNDSIPLCLLSALNLESKIAFYANYTWFRCKVVPPGLFFYVYIYIMSPNPKKPRRPHTTSPKPHQLKTPTPKT